LKPKPRSVPIKNDCLAAEGLTSSQQATMGILKYAKSHGIDEKRFWFSNDNWVKLDYLNEV